MSGSRPARATAESTPGRRVLMWFRADLRVSDNTALWHAARQAEEAGEGVVACFLIAADQWQEHDWAGVKVDFILRHLRCLRDELGALNIPLIVVAAPRFSDAPGVIVRLAREHGCGSVFFNREYEVNELRRDAAVTDACAAAGIKARGFTDQTVIEPGEVRTGNGMGGFYTVFSPFKRALYRIIEERGGITVLDAPRKQRPIDVRGADAPIPSTVAGFTSHARAGSEMWPAGERHARERLARFVDTHIRAYKTGRDFPGLGATSVLSPYLCAGSISPRQCLLAAVNANNGKLDGGNESIGHWISEVAWREFYKHILVGFPRVCMGRAFKVETDRLHWADNPDALEAWRAGRTGVPIVDAGMRQLLETGWMHNRVRMIAAMYLTKNLFIDWREGERHFMRHLIDGDLAQNNGGWQWSASTGTDAAPYFRIFNPISQSRRFDPDGTYIRKYVPELTDLEGGEKGEIHDPSELPALLRSRVDYPEPLVDLSKSRDRAIRAFQELA